MAQFAEEKQKRKLELLKKREEEESVKILSEKYGLSYADLSAYPVEVDAIKLVSEEKAREAELAVFQVTGNRLKIAVRNPERGPTQAVLRRLEEANYTYELFLVSRTSLERAWSFYKKVPEEHELTAATVQVSSQRLAALRKEIKTLEDVKKLVEKTFSAKTTELLEIIVAGGLATEASDIHIEAQETGLRLRYRLDGVLYDVIALPLKLYPLLLSRIKLVSELKLNIHDKAQDGRFTIHIDTADVEVRTSILPGPQGENVVLRILNPKSIEIPFAELGMQPWVTEEMSNELKKPNGMILTTGPTGSGKTTTLYAFLKKIHTPAIKIITIEDPIEYHLLGIEQTQVDAEKGYDFANGLRAIVRQDPDVILVGEIRDIETAETAMHAALTGHLVFSTLHTNSAAGTIPRLLDLGVRPSIIAPAINITMAQRLVRRLCPKCRIATRLGTKEKNKLEEELNQFPKNVSLPEPKKWTVYKPSSKNCPDCNSLGYKGRVGVFEIILVDDAVERLILKEPSEFEIKKEALRQGQLTMRQDGILKVLAGITDFEELERVVGV